MFTMTDARTLTGPLFTIARVNTDHEQLPDDPESEPLPQPDLYELAVRLLDTGLEERFTIHDVFARR